MVFLFLILYESSDYIIFVNNTVQVKIIRSVWVLQYDESVIKFI